eukprot:12248104-Ditylum_brightwellii.AAC.1
MASGTLLMVSNPLTPLRRMPPQKNVHRCSLQPKQQQCFHNTFYAAFVCWMIPYISAVTPQNICNWTLGDPNGTPKA